MTRFFSTCPSRQKQDGHNDQDDCHACPGEYDCRLAYAALGRLPGERLETALAIFFRHVGARLGESVFLQAFVDLGYVLGAGRFNFIVQKAQQDPQYKRELAEYLKLAESWHRMTESMLESMDKYWQQRFADVDWLEEGPESYRNLSVRLREALSHEISGTKEKLEGLGAGRRGRRPAWALRGFIQDLMHVWQEYTGEKPTATYDPCKEEYTSDFLDFVEAVSPAVGITPGRRFVAQVVWDTCVFRPKPISDST